MEITATIGHLLPSWFFPPLSSSPGQTQNGHPGRGPKACVFYTTHEYIMALAFWQENLYKAFCVLTIKKDPNTIYSDLLVLGYQFIVLG